MADKEGFGRGATKNRAPLCYSCFPAGISMKGRFARSGAHHYRKACLVSGTGTAAQG